ncbi:hypothetical protein COLO4_33344 [Corchorus olitorius]|uniref:Prolamin-like domain-containing protein n=1 Tax=Corchorus olitorius TaxID=93759 RepID=A0A1R3GUQ8_9ROSI|nr:hypothetical protein COLO4_33344 [Corchorus olitorius]
MASLNFYATIGVLVIVASGAVMGREIDPIKANNCEDKSKMTWHCIVEISTSVFKTGSVTDGCCHQLVSLGNICHEALVKRSLKNPLYKKNDTSVILSKAAQVWNKCASANDVSPNPSP